ncbi:MAG TPA: precorrin-2 C(20)-methyltransferase [Clostridia bacterium]|nr:precorrin-2 C(20)-methyltransferase [Clostridia bacterium]
MLSSDAPGKLYGISVGPGDPELLTLKAVRTIKLCPVLAVPRTHGARTLALDIAEQAVDISNKDILYLDFLMSDDARATKENHARHAERIAAVLEKGRNVGMLSLGDASLYSTFPYIAERIIKLGYEAETVPGVTSFCACAAVLNRSLTEMRLPLTILPASYECLEEALDLPGGKIVMKPARTLARIKALAAKKGLAEKAAAVTDCGLPSQSVHESICDMPEDGYFTTILIRP